MIKDLKPRLYQEMILATASLYNTLVTIPTGLGKTIIAVLVSAQRLNNYPNTKIVFLAPTKPLCMQHKEVFLKHLNIEKEKINVFTGETAPEERQKVWQSSVIVISTPQGLENDLISGRISLENVSLVIFDEAHKAVKDYSYVWIAKQYQNTAKYPRILGLTASPGSDLDKIKEICANLFIEKVEARTESDPDVKHYVKDIDIKWIPVKLPDSFKMLKRNLETCYKNKLSEIKSNGYLDTIEINKSELLSLQGALQGELANGNKDWNLLKSMSLCAEALKVQHALELLESQGISPLNTYLTEIAESAKTTKVKAVINLMNDMYFNSAITQTKNMAEAKVEHPKLDVLRDIVKDSINKNEKVIIFNQYRDSASKILEELNSITGVTAKLFFGQMKKKGMGLSQKEQKEILDQFRNNEFNVLISTSVGEEGIDIPSVDKVIFYEPVPSAIRHIQRRGRTGRNENGEVIILYTEGTRDVGYRWSAFHKEKKMHSLLKEIKNDPTLTKNNNDDKNTLEQYIKPQEDLTIIADYREKGSNTIKELISLGVKIDLRKIDCGDYLCSDRVCIEFKETPDFVDSIIDGRLFEQAKNMIKNFVKCLIIIEGERDLYSVRNINPNAIKGAIITINYSFGIPIIYTKNAKDTAKILYMLAKKEQIDEGNKNFNIHANKKPMSVKELQEYIISALPGIGTTLNKPLLQKFKTVKNIMNAEPDRLREVEFIGEKKAEEIRKVLNDEYKD